MELAFLLVISVNIFGNESLPLWSSMLLIWNVGAKAWASRHSYLRFGAASFFCLTMVQSHSCTSSWLTSIDFEDGEAGTCPEYWTCDDVSITRLYNGDWFTTPDGEYMLIVGQDQLYGKAKSLPFVLPDGIDHIQYLNAGGADSGSGFWVKRYSDDTDLCHSTDGTDTNTLFETSCDGLEFYAGELVYFQAEDNQASGWGKVVIDHIRVQDAGNKNLQFCFFDFSTIPSLQTCASAILSNVDFEDGIIGSCPTYWTCDDDSVSRLYDGDRYSTSDGDTMFIIGQNNDNGKAVSDTLILPDGIDHVQYLHGGGVYSGSGFWVKKYSDDTTLCRSMNGTGTDTLFESSCGGLGLYAGELVYFQGETDQVSAWGRLVIDYIRLQDANNNNLPFCFDIASVPTLQTCASAVMTKIDFEDGIIGSCPDYWICDDDSVSKLYDGDGYITSDGDTIFIVGRDDHWGSAVSETLFLPERIDHVQYLHAGGADSGSGFWVKRTSDRATLCHFTDGTDTNTLFEATCDGLAEYAGQSVYFQAEDNQNSGWGKLAIDYIRLQDANNDNLQFCFGTHPGTLPPTTLPTVAPTASPTTPVPTNLPSTSPTPSPTVLPTARSEPTNLPTRSPSVIPTRSFSPSTFPSESPTSAPTFPTNPSSTMTGTGGRTHVSNSILQVIAYLSIFFLLLAIVVILCCRNRAQARKSVQLEMKIAEMSSFRSSRCSEPEGFEGEDHEDMQDMQMPTSYRR